MKSFRLKTALLFVTGIAIALGVWINWDKIPGTLRFDSRGFPHGTGTKSYYYTSGQLKQKEHYRQGLMDAVDYYKPSGELFAATTFDKQHGGIEYYLREDGTVFAKLSFKYRPADNDYVADGEATYYDRDGKVAQVVQYVDGVAATPIVARP